MSLLCLFCISCTCTIDVNELKIERNIIKLITPSIRSKIKMVASGKV